MRAPRRAPRSTSTTWRWSLNGVLPSLSTAILSMLGTVISASTTSRSQSFVMQWRYPARHCSVPRGTAGIRQNRSHQCSSPQGAPQTTSRVHRRIAEHVNGVHIHVRCFKERLDHITMASTCGATQRRISVSVQSVRANARHRKEHLDHVEMAKTCGIMQRRRSHQCSVPR